VLTVSEFSKRQIVECYNIPEEKVTVTYNGVAGMFSPIHDNLELDQRLNRFSIDKPYILAVGNLQPRKNIERLVRVYAKLRKQGLIEQDLVLVGQMHWQGHAILEEIENNAVTQHVKTTGYVSDEELVALYNRADLFVYPSLYEGFGLPVIESMACGTPVITSDVSSIPEVAGDAAILIDPLSDDSISAQLLRLANDASLRLSLSDKGIIQAKKFDWRLTAEKTLSILQRAG
jgi:glycosyltransferase involved in cell wall biosynthesis